VNQVFVDRNDELRALEEEYKKKGARFCVIYGRRRVGKTEIVRRFMAGKNGVYYLADRRGARWNIKDFQKAVEDAGVKNFSAYGFEDWISLFKILRESLENERFIVVIDEFPNLVEDSTLSEFQKAWDLYISNSNIFLILVGSSISMMQRLTLDYSSPLYGRRTMQLRVEKMKFWDAWKFMHKYSLKDFLSIYAVTDGIPYYLLQMNPDLNWKKNIMENALSKNSVLYEEAEFLLRMELREFRHYYPIIEAIATGKRRFNEIMDYTHMDSGTLSKYLSNLINIGVVRTEIPMFGRKKNRRYRLSDNYFTFYFAFIKPHRHLLEVGAVKDAWERMEDRFNTYLGNVL